MKDLERLKNASLRNYEAENFKKHWMEEKYWGTSKRRRVINRDCITVYSTFRKRLLSRTFYLIEGYENKKRYHEIYEVERMLAGSMKKLIRYLISNMSGDYNISFEKSKWTETSLNSYVLDGRRSYYSHPRTTKHNSYENFLNKSIHKYCAIEYLNASNNLEMFRYLHKYDKHPQLEVLIKLGLKHIYEKDLRLIHWKQKGLKMLDIEKHELVYLQSGMQLSEYRQIRKFVNDHKLTVDKANTYLRMQWVSYKQLLYIEDKKNSFLYEDYIEFANKLGLVMNSKVKYPKDIKKAHDKLLKQITTLENKETDEKILKVAKKLSKLNFNDEEFVIFPAESTHELIEESKKLDHCVRTYANDVAAGRTSIFFIRKVEKKEKPLCTLELKNKKIMQVRAKNNKEPNEKVMNFIREWENKFKLNGSLI